MADEKVAHRCLLHLAGAAGRGTEPVDKRAFDPAVARWQAKSMPVCTKQGSAGTSRKHGSRLRLPIIRRTEGEEMTV